MWQNDTKIKTNSNKVSEGEIVNKPVLAVVEGGGCAQIECATGIFKAMEDNNIFIDKYTGSSAGACIAALHASGLSGRKLEELIKSTPADELFTPCILHQVESLFGATVDHLMTAEGMYNILKKYVNEKARNNVRVAVTKLPNFEPMMCDATPITCMASAAIPVVFEPVKIGDAYFVDGGVKNMIPTPPIKDIGNYKHIYIILCVDDVETNREYNRIERAYRTALATMEREVTQIYEDAWDELPNVTVIHPTPYEANLLEWSTNFGLIEHAYNYTMKLLSEKQNAKHT